MRVTRILIASELRSYRQAIASAFRELRPDTEVFEAEPGDLNREVLRLRPDIVICSQVTPLVKECSPNWVELYPYREPRSTVFVNGEESDVQDIQLSDLLGIADKVGRMVQLN
jgi:hypothetical protein